LNTSDNEAVTASFITHTLELRRWDIIIIIIISQQFQNPIEMSNK